MKKIVLKVNIDDEKSKRRAMRTVAGVEGVESVAVNMKERMITVVGEVDRVHLIAELRETGLTPELLSVGPAKEEKKVGADSAKEEKKKTVSEWDIKKKGSNHYLGVQKMMSKRAIENEGSEKRIKEAVEGFGDFISIEVDIKKGMVTVVGKLVPVDVAMKVREMGYRAKLLSVGSVDVTMKDGNQYAPGGARSRVHPVGSRNHPSTHFYDFTRNMMIVLKRPQMGQNSSS